MCRIPEHDAVHKTIIEWVSALDSSIKVHCFGSHALGVCSDNSDLDLVCVAVNRCCKFVDRVDFFHHLELLYNNQVELFRIVYAKVPLVHNKLV